MWWQGGVSPGEGTWYARFKWRAEERFREGQARTAEEQVRIVGQLLATCEPGTYEVILEVAMKAQDDFHLLLLQTLERAGGVEPLMELGEGQQ
jgi:hypothetical protein